MKLISSIVLIKPFWCSNWGSTLLVKLQLVSWMVSQEYSKFLCTNFIMVSTTFNVIKFDIHIHKVQKFPLTLPVQFRSWKFINWIFKFCLCLTWESLRILFLFERFRMDFAEALALASESIMQLNVMQSRANVKLVLGKSADIWSAKLSRD